MKRIWAALFGVVGCLLVGAGPAAEAPAAGRAVVFSVPTSGEVSRFEVPQVWLTNAAVARRINRVLMRYFRSGSFGDVDSTRSPRQQLREAAHVCCFDAETKTWWVGGQGLSAMSYEVLLNQDYLLSFAFSESNQGLEQPGGPHLTFDLRTGRVLRLADLVADPPAQLNRRLRAAISRRLRDELGQAVEDYGDDSTRIDYVASRYQIGTWNTTPQRGLALDMADSPSTTANEIPAYPTKFALSPDALLLFYSVGMSRLDFEFLPDDTYTFPWTRLQPKSILLPLVKASGSRKKTSSR